MPIEIEIVGAVFKCKADEDVFYHRLSEITGIQKVTTKGTKLYVSVCRTQENLVIEEIRVICDIWHVSYRRHA